MESQDDRLLHFSRFYLLLKNLVLPRMAGSSMGQAWIVRNPSCSSCTNENICSSGSTMLFEYRVIISVEYYSEIYSAAVSRLDHRLYFRGCFGTFNFVQGQGQYAITQKQPNI